MLYFLISFKINANASDVKFCALEFYSFLFNVVNRI